MHRIKVSYLLIFSLFLLGIESAVESAQIEYLHDGDSVVHIGDSDLASPHANDNKDHCTHCCHFHPSALASKLSCSFNVVATNRTFVFDSSHRVYHPLGPPTPPPNT